MVSDWIFPVDIEKVKENDEKIKKYLDRVIEKVGLCDSIYQISILKMDTKFFDTEENSVLNWSDCEYVMYITSNSWANGDEEESYNLILDLRKWLDKKFVMYEERLKQLDVLLHQCKADEESAWEYLAETFNIAFRIKTVNIMDEQLFQYEGDDEKSNLFTSVVSNRTQKSKHIEIIKDYILHEKKMY